MSDYEAAFRQYGNITDSLKDYAELLKEGIGGNQFFYKGAWKSETITYKEATNYLTGRYATDRNYDEKLNALIEAYQLTSYDNEAVGFSTTEKNMIYPITEPVISSTFGLRGNEFHRGWTLRHLLDRLFKLVFQELLFALSISLHGGIM